MKNACLTVAAAGLTTAALAEPELHFVFDQLGGTNWSLYAELVNPTGTVIAAIADLGFTVNGTNIANFSYNSAFDSSFFGPATVNVTSTSIDFIGSNTLPPLNNAGGVDSSNPLAIATFTADNIDVDSFDLVGQVTGAYAGVPFPEILFYQNADGSDGDTVWCKRFTCTPTPGTATAALLGGVAFMRRRR